MKLDLVMTPEIRERAKRPFLHVTRHGVCAEQSPGAWEELHRILAIHPVTEPDAEYIGASFNDSHSPGDGVMRYDAGVVVPGTKPPPGLALGTVAGGRYAVFRYRGSYRHIWNAMDQIFRGWAARNSDTLRNAPLLEIYLNDPRTTPEKDLLTDLCVPVM